ncbi:MAG: energy-coupling factor transporter ATPase [Clostridia bacterium]|nr:energy-coupling factor transporter ATPase [Clostridia bacterium]
MDNIITLDKVSFAYESEDKNYEVLKDFSVSFERGTFNVVLGHNGSGKSTLAKLLNGLIKPVSGTVSVNGLSTLDDESDFIIKKAVGMVFQNPDNQLVSSVVEEDVAFGPENLGLSPEEIRRRVDNALKAVDMYDMRLNATHKLSGGQKQRVAIAGIIAMEPECIVLDEPTAMLDPKGRKEVIDTILKLNKEKGITVILITHFMEEAEFADRVLVMSDGNIISDGTPCEIFSQVEKIKSAGLSVPQTTDLLFKLKTAGYNVDNNVISADVSASIISNLIDNSLKK